VKIAFDAQIFQRQKFGGISRYFTEMAKELCKLDGIEIRFLSPIHRNYYLQNSFRSEFFTYRLPIYPNRMGIGQKIDSISDFIASKQVLKYNPDIIHETFFASKIDPLNKASRVLTVYDLIRETENPKSDISIRNMASIKRASAVICISESTRVDLLNLVPIDPSMVSTVHLAAAKIFYECRTVDSEWIPEDYILYVGQRNGYKNFDRMLKAFARASSLRSSFQLAVFGGGDFNPYEIELIRTLGIEHNIKKFDGNDTVLADLYKHASALIYPSLYEGFGIPVIEAMAAGCPVICSGNSSLPEIAGDAAIFFDPKSEDSMTDAMLKTLQNSKKLEEIRSKGVIRSTLFSWEKTARETAQIYRALTS